MSNPLVKSARRSLRRGSTLRDWVIGGAVVGLLLLGLIPWIVHQRAESRKTFCSHRLQQITLATLFYHSREKQLPFYRSESQGAWQDLPSQSWAATILPWLPHGKDAFPAEGLRPDARGRLPEWLCPDRPLADDDTSPLLSYVINAGQPDANPPAPLPPDGIASGISFDGLPRERARRIRLSLGQLETMDGTGYTLLASESLDAGRWTESAEAQVGFVWSPHLGAKPPSAARIERINARKGEGDGSIRFARPSSLHGGGVNVAFCSGRLLWIDEGIDDVVWARLLTSHDAALTDPATGEPLGEPYRAEPSSGDPPPEDRDPEDRDPEDRAKQ